MADDEPFRAELSTAIQKRLARLHDEVREMLLLVAVGDLTHQETADRLGVPLGTRLADAIMASGRRGADGLDH